MNWLLWRQHRAQAFVTAVSFALFAIVVAITGVHMAHEYTDATRACAANGTCSLIGNLFQIDAIAIAARVAKFVSLIGDVGDPAAHARRKVFPRFAEHDHQTLGHVFAAVVAHPLDHGRGTGIAHRESLARAPTEKCFTRRRAIQRDVSDHDIFVGLELRPAARIDDQRSAG